MSFLAGRLAATEGAYFLQESKHAVGRLAQKHPPPTPSSSSAAVAAAAAPKNEEAADVLPEILRHSIHLKGTAAEAAPSLSTASKWLLQHSSSHSRSPASTDALNPLRAYVSIPQATFGPKRWQLPNEHPQFSASTANELRRDKYPPMDPEKLKAVVEGYSQIGKAFVVATMIVFGGATAVFLLTAHKLQLHSTDDIRTKGRDLIQPGADILREQMVPLSNWAENMSRKWHIENGKTKDKSLIKEISKTLGRRKSD